MDPAQLIFFVAILVLFWLLMIRPATRRQKELRAMQQGLAVGQRVMLASGIFGTITSLDDDRVGLAIADGVEVEVVRAAISNVDTPVGVEEQHGAEGA